MFQYITDNISSLKLLLYTNKINPKLVSAILAYLIITPIDAILYLQWINSMGNYKWLAGGIIYPFFGLLFFAVPTIYKMYKNSINTNCCPTFDLAKIGLMDSMGSILAALTIPFISIMLNVVVSKLILPMTMIASYFVLNKKYLWTHYTGVLITIFGVLASAIPKMESSTDNTNPLAMIVFICSLIPGVISYIIKETYLKKNPNADSWYMNTLISGFQLCVGIITLPMVMLPLPELHVEPEKFGQYISNSFNCQFGGKNSMDGDDCKFSFLYLILFQIFGTIANILMFTIIREGSSVMFIMINTLKTPITALMGFCLIYYNVIKFTAGESFVLTWLDVISLIFVVIGSIFYSLKEEISNESNVGDKNKLLKNLLILNDEEYVYTGSSIL